MWQVSKRSGNLQPFSQGKIVRSIIRAQENISKIDEVLADKVAKLVGKDLKSKYSKETVIGSDDIGDCVERTLIEHSYYDIAKAYIIARERQRQEARAGRGLGVTNDLGLSYNQLVVISNKYLQRDDDGNIIETPKEMFERVAKALAKAEPAKTRKEHQQAFFELMTQMRFLPGGRTLANAGTINNQLANCFVLPMPDSVEGIFEVVKESSILKKNGGGVGFSLGRIRPKGDKVATTTGRAAGPVAVMHILNHASDMLLQAGGRRSGNMIVMPVSHPDIFEFLTCKEEESALPHINFSLGVTSKFMQAVEKDKVWDLINPRDGEVVNQVDARSIFDLATTMAWKNGDPGMVFLDKINQDNPTPQVGPIESVNLCGEQPLLPYEACNLGSINLAAHLKYRPKEKPSRTIKLPKNTNLHSHSNVEVDWDKLSQTVQTAVRMLDDVVAICTYPLKKIDDVVKANRKIGLGVMGWADLLVRLEIPYNSSEALKLAEKISAFIHEEGVKTSQKLAQEKGAFPNWKGSALASKKLKPQRNATITTIAPTGSIAMIAGCSYGIEPHFALAFYKEAMGGYKLPEINPDLLKQLQKIKLADNGLVEEIMEAGSIQHISEIPKRIQDIFVTAHDLAWEDHIKMQSAWQKGVDNAVSKTINLRHDASVEDVASAYKLAWKLGCKGITVYRDASRSVQVLNVGNVKSKSKTQLNKPKIKIPDITGKMKSRAAEKCPQCGATLQIHEGCKTCPSCAFSACSL
ncbi:adenosylcobalamin-dependent ribonucleoside-diphosphate reductase [Candidatus Beckwithbacteria bacterium]|nr:adenosylcobalamin-dependent ribonucleoside-diphosphate reductase [Candidatus Beckwithbacteria bacterium]